jgi:tetratricopeptide (TPR) repeat protein
VWTRRYAFIALLVVGYLAVRSEVLPDVTAGGTKAIELALFDEPIRPLLSLLYSLQTIFAPVADLQYEPHLAAWLSPLRALFAVACVAGLGSLAQQRGGTSKPALLFFAGWGIATLLPSANILAQETHFAERYVVLPYLGVVGFVACLSGELWKRQPLQSWLTGAVVLALVALGLMSHNRGQFFENDYRFLTQWAKSDPTSHQSRSSLGEYYRKRKQFAEAIPYERESLRLLHEALPEPLCIKRHFAFAEALTGNAQYEEAAAEYEEILRMRPSFSGARRLLGRVRKQAAQAQQQQPRAWSGEGGLHEESRARLLQDLSTEAFAGRPVWLTATSADSRSAQMMGEVKDVFLQAGWSVEASETVEFSLKPGVFIFVAEDEVPDYVQSLEPLLAAAGLPVTTLATGYRAYAEDKLRDSPDWKGIRLGPEQAYVIVIGRSGQ